MYEAVASESLQAVQDRVSELAHEVHRETAKLVPLRHLNVRRTAPVTLVSRLSNIILYLSGGSVAEWLACSTQVQKGPGSNRSRDTVG